MKIQYLIVLAGLLIGGFYLGKASESVNMEVNNTTTLDHINTRVKNASTSSSYESKVEENAAEVAPTETKTRLVTAEQATIELFEEAAPSVCFINTSNLQRDYYSRKVYEQPTGSGSGFIWDKSGHIVTNYHVIKGAQKATVTLSDHTTYEATLVGVDPNKDLAVLKINAPNANLVPIPTGISNNLRVGQFVYAIGNPFGLDHTLTTGVISALGREIQSLTGRPIRDAIQTDAAINPGNSGGPLLDSQGKLIGVNTQIYSPSGASAGIGFSIPVDEVNWVVPDLIKYGEVRRPILGVSLLPSQYANDFGVKEGVMVADIIEGGPASKIGLQAIKQNSSGQWIKGDIIRSLQDIKIKDYNDLVLALEKHQPGEKVSLTLDRDGKSLKKDIILGESK